MATYVPAKRGVEYITYVSLVSQADAKLLKANPTLAAGDVQVSKDGGAFANLTTLPTVTPAAGKGVKVTLSATEMTADNVLVIFSDAAGAEWCDLSLNIQTAARQIDDLATPTNITAGTITTATNLTNLPAIPANWLTAAGIADGAIDRATFAADTGLQNIRAGTAQAGAATTITLDASASAVDSFYNELWVYITGGAGIGQARAITAYVGATKVATITPNWITNPDATSTFAIIVSARNDAVSAGSTDWSAAERNQIRQALGVDGTKAATVSGNLDAVKTKTDFLPSATAGAAGGLFIAGTNAATAVTTGLTATFTGNLTGSVNSVTNDVGITQAGADKTWLTATRALTDKAGFALSSAGVQAIWDALTSALTTVGSIGKLIVDNLNATISSRASQASLDTLDDYVDTEVAAIKAKTDALPAAPAATGDAMALTGSERTTLAGVIGTTAQTESYRANGAIGSIVQILYEILAHLTEASISGTTKTVKKIDHTATATTSTLDSATAPTSITRTT